MSVTLPSTGCMFLVAFCITAVMITALLLLRSECVIILFCCVVLFRKGISQSSLPFRRSVPTVFIFLHCRIMYNMLFVRHKSSSRARQGLIGCEYQALTVFARPHCVKF